MVCSCRCVDFEVLFVHYGNLCDILMKMDILDDTERRLKTVTFSLLQNFSDEHACKPHRLNITESTNSAKEFPILHLLR